MHEWGFMNVKLQTEVKLDEKMNVSNYIFTRESSKA